MPCISLWQPYASLIAGGHKPFETRHWPAPPHIVGRRIAIHAAKRRPTRDEIGLVFDRVADAFGFCHWHDRIPYGAVVCTATLVASVRVAAYEDGTVTLADGRRFADDGFGDYAEGRYCWEMNEVTPLPKPAPARGLQGWWTWAPYGAAPEGVGIESAQPPAETRTRGPARAPLFGELPVQHAPLPPEAAALLRDLAEGSATDDDGVLYVCDADTATAARALRRRGLVRIRRDPLFDGEVHLTAEGRDLAARLAAHA